MRSFEHVTAVSAREAISSLSGGAGDARVVAGGTDLLIQGAALGVGGGTYRFDGVRLIEAYRAAHPRA